VPKYQPARRLLQSLQAGHQANSSVDTSANVDGQVRHFLLGFLDAEIAWGEFPLPRTIASDYSKLCDPSLVGQGFRLHNIDELKERDDFRMQRFASIVGLITILWQVFMMALALFSVPAFPVPLVGKWTEGAVTEGGDARQSVALVQSAPSVPDSGASSKRQVSEVDTINLHLQGKECVAMAGKEDPELLSLCPGLLAKVVTPPDHHEEGITTRMYLQVKLQNPAKVSGFNLSWSAQAQSVLFFTQLAQNLVSAWMSFIVHQPNVFFFIASPEHFLLTFRVDIWRFPLLAAFRFLVNFGSTAKLNGFQGHWA